MPDIGKVLPIFEHFGVWSFVLARRLKSVHMEKRCLKNTPFSKLLNSRRNLEKICFVARRQMCANVWFVWQIQQILEITYNEWQNHKGWIVLSADVSICLFSLYASIYTRVQFVTWWMSGSGFDSGSLSGFAGGTLIPLSKNVHVELDVETLNWVFYMLTKLK